MSIIFHIANREVWERDSHGDYEPEQFATDGFIHCSTPEQLLPVANLRFRGQLELVLLEIDTDLVTPEIRYENLEGGLKLFPHIYGQLERKAVVRVREFTPGLDGFFSMPE
jgi:uncharacterized protein (DUF952 family)